MKVFLALPALASAATLRGGAGGRGGDDNQCFQDSECPNGDVCNGGICTTPWPTSSPTTSAPTSSPTTSAPSYAPYTESFSYNPDFTLDIPFNIENDEAMLAESLKIYEENYPDECPSKNMGQDFPWMHTVGIRFDYDDGRGMQAQGQELEMCFYACLTFGAGHFENDIFASGNWGDELATCEFAVWKEETGECVVFSRSADPTNGGGDCDGHTGTYIVPNDDYEGFASIRNNFSDEPDSTYYIASPFDGISSDAFDEAVDNFEEITSVCPTDKVSWLAWGYTLGVRVGGSGSDAQILTKDQCKYLCSTGLGEYAYYNSGNVLHSCEFAVWKAAEYQPVFGQVDHYDEEVGECIFFSQTYTPTAMDATPASCDGHQGTFLVRKYEIVSTISNDIFPIGGLALDFIDFVQNMDGSSLSGFAFGNSAQHSYHCEEDMPNAVKKQTTNCGGEGCIWKDVTNKCRAKNNAWDIADTWNAAYTCGDVYSDFYYNYEVFPQHLEQDQTQEEFWNGGFKDLVVNTFEQANQYVAVARHADADFKTDDCSVGYRKLQLRENTQGSHHFPNYIDQVLYKWSTNGDVDTVARFDYALSGYDDDYPNGVEPTEFWCTAEAGIAVGALGLVTGFVPVLGPLSLALGATGVVQASVCAAI